MSWGYKDIFASSTLTSKLTTGEPTIINSVHESVNPTHNNIVIDQYGVSSVYLNGAIAPILAKRRGTTGAWIADLNSAQLSNNDWVSLTDTTANREYLDVVFNCLVEVKAIKLQGQGPVLIGSLGDTNPSPPITTKGAP